MCGAGARFGVAPAPEVRLATSRGKETTMTSNRRRQQPGTRLTVRRGPALPIEAPGLAGELSRPIEVPTPAIVPVVVPVDAAGGLLVDIVDDLCGAYLARRASPRVWPAPTIYA